MQENRRKENDYQPFPQKSVGGDRRSGDWGGSLIFCRAPLFLVASRRVRTYQNLVGLYRRSGDLIFSYLFSCDKDSIFSTATARSKIFCHLFAFTAAYLIFWLFCRSDTWTKASGGQKWQVGRSMSSMRMHDSFLKMFALEGVIFHYCWHGPG